MSACGKTTIRGTRLSMRRTMLGVTPQRCRRMLFTFVATLSSRSSVLAYSTSCAHKHPLCVADNLSALLHPAQYARSSEDVPLWAGAGNVATETPCSRRRCASRPAWLIWRIDPLSLRRTPAPTETATHLERSMNTASLQTSMTAPLPTQGHPAADSALSFRTMLAALNADFAFDEDEFLDPVTRDVIVDPVVASDGNTYDRCCRQRGSMGQGTRCKPQSRHRH